MGLIIPLSHYIIFFQCISVVNCLFVLLLWVDKQFCYSNQVIGWDMHSSVCQCNTPDMHRQLLKNLMGMHLFDPGVKFKQMTWNTMNIIVRITWLMFLCHLYVNIIDTEVKLSTHVALLFWRHIRQCTLSVTPPKPDWSQCGAGSEAMQRSFVPALLPIEFTARKNATSERTGESRALVMHLNCRVTGRCVVRGLSAEVTC